MSRGLVHIPNAATERIAETVALFGGETFSIEEILRFLPDLGRQSVLTIIAKKARQGYLNRRGYGRYQTSGLGMKTSLPQSIVTDAVWTALFTNPGAGHLSSSYITGEVESFINRPGLRLQRNVTSILHVWYRHGFLERIGKRGHFHYRVMDGLTERPVYNPNI